MLDRFSIGVRLMFDRLRLDWGWNYAMREVWKPHVGGVEVSCGKYGSLMLGRGSLMSDVELSCIKLSRVCPVIENCV